MKKILFLIMIIGLFSSCEKEHNSTIKTAILQCDYDFEKFSYFSNGKSSEEDIIGYFDDLTGNGILKLIGNGAEYHSAIRHRLNTIISDSTDVDSIALKLQTMPNESDIYISSVYAEPFNSVDGWTLAYWFNSDLYDPNDVRNIEQYVFDVRDDSIVTHNGIDWIRWHNLIGICYFKNEMILYKINYPVKYDFDKDGRQIIVDTHIRPDTLLSTAPVIIDDIFKWNHYVFSCLHNMIKIYLNGEFIYSENLDFNDNKFTAFYLSSFPLNYGAQYLDNLSIWSKPLSDQKILNLYNNQR